jgi:ketosteroid isomerase-like protein
VSEGDHRLGAPAGSSDLSGMVQRLRSAIEGSDPAAFGELLDPNVTWGPPGAREGICTNRRQVLAWYERGLEQGGSAVVTEITDLGGKLLVGLVVHGTGAAKERGGAALRWQLLTLRNGRITDIAGFDLKDDALAYAAHRSNR